MTRRLIPFLAAALFLAPWQSAVRAAENPAKASAAARKNLLPEKADEAWDEVKKAMNPPSPPKEWNEKAPSEDEQKAFRKQMSILAGVAADKAKEFQVRFADDPRAAKAKDDERRMLAAAVGLGDESRTEALKAAGGPPAPQQPQEAQDPLQAKLREAAQSAQAKRAEGLPVVFAEFEKAVRALQKDFPDRPEIYAALLEVCEGLGPEKARAIAKEIAEAKTEPSLKEQAAGLLKKLDRVGKPVAIAFTAVDGRKIDLLEMKGKVVLVDFWATWCGPCIAELPNVKAAYEKFHPKGFEIVGISFDQEKDTLAKFVAKKQMPWAQYFDGEGWGNKFGREFGISSIPTMWLIDKKGNLVDQTAREDLAGKVEKLLGEP